MTSLDSFADRLAKWERLTGVVTPTLLDALALAPGEHVLDVGCGVGAATLQAARIVGPSGAVAGVDISAPAVEAAAARAASAHLQQVSFQVADAATDRFAGGPFTAAMSQFGVLFFADQVAAFANIRRQLAAGGRLCFASWQTADRNPWSFAATLRELMPPPPRGVAGGPPPGPFSLSDPARIRRVLCDAGFDTVDVTGHEGIVDVPEDTVVDDGELSRMGVPDEHMPEARALVSRQLDPHRGPGDLLHLPFAYFVVSAR